MSKYAKVVIYPKDVANITGKTYRSSWVLLNKVKAHYQKGKHQVVSVQELCDYLGLSPEDIATHI